MLRRPPLMLPRPLIFFASIWLVGSWLLSIGIRQPMQPSWQNYAPGVRMMLHSLIIGVMIGWPLLRLSQRPAFYPARQTLLDVIVLVSTIQVVLWPLRLVTPWTVSRTLLIDVTICVWLMLAAAVVALLVRTRDPLARIAGMLVCIALCLAGPAIALLGVAIRMPNDPDGATMISPLVGVHRLATGNGSPTTPEDWAMIRWVAITAGIAWLAVFLLPRRDLHLTTADDAEDLSQSRYG